MFAPADAAFAKLPAGTVEAVLKDKKKLTKIFIYHVVAGEVMSKDGEPGKDNVTAAGVIERLSVPPVISRIPPPRPSHRGFPVSQSYCPNARPAPRRALRRRV